MLVSITVPDRCEPAFLEAARRFLAAVRRPPPPALGGSRLKFFVGLHQPGDSQHFSRAFISVNRLRTRIKTPIAAQEWIMDSGAFTEVSTYGGYRTSVEEYADEINRWS